MQGLVNYTFFIFLSFIIPYIYTQTCPRPQIFSCSIDSPVRDGHFRNHEKAAKHRTTYSSSNLKETISTDSQFPPSIEEWIVKKQQENDDIKKESKANQEQHQDTPKETSSTTQSPNPNPIIHPRISSSTKDRFNFASFDCGAIIRAQNPEAKSATAILSSNKDSYMLNQCDSQMYIVVELCEEILVDTIVLSNLELFSSMFRDVSLSISNQYPIQYGKAWVHLATLHAKNVRGEQVFYIPNSVMWAKYIHVEFKSHYGSEFYCPVTVLKVFGKTMMEDLRRENEESANISGDREKSRKKLRSDLISWRNVDFSLDPDELAEYLESSEFSEWISKQNQGFNSNAPPAGSETGSENQESVFKSILKRLQRLEQNVTLSLAYLSQHHKRLHAVYNHLDTSIQQKVDVFLSKLGRQVMDGMGEIIAEYETVLDSWISDLALVKKKMTVDIERLKYRINILGFFVFVIVLISGFLLLKRLGFIEWMRVYLQPRLEVRPSPKIPAIITEARVSIGSKKGGRIRRNSIG